MIRPSLKQASTIIEASFAKGLELNAKPLTVAILDQGGQLKAFKRQDGSSLLRPEIAMGKAWGALGMGQNSRQLGEVAAERPSFIAAAVAASGGRLVPVPGGVLIREVAEGEICGAVGISGDTSDLDEECAIAGIEAAGLIAG